MRRLPHILALILLPSLAACGSGETQPAPPSPEAEAAIHDDGGARHDELGRAIDGLFDDAGVGRTSALLIVKRGSVIVERYASGITPDTPLPGWSMGQCINALMIGLLVSDGRLRLNEGASVPAWQRPGDPRGTITLRQLLQMRSGLRLVGEDDPGDPRSDRFRMLFLEGRDDMAAFAEAQPLAAPAGRVFAPGASTGTILDDLAARVLSESPDPAARRKAVSEFLSARLLKPTGMTHTTLEFDRAGTLVGASLIHASAHDWARIGELIRHTGSVKGAQVLPRRWIQFMLAPSPRNPGYGAGVWLNRSGPAAAPAATSSGAGPVRAAGTRSSNRLYAGQAPANLFGCLGEYGQYVLGSPDQLLTVVRLGETGPDQEEALHRQLGALLALFPGYR